jgi:hypothetical protein
MIDDGGAANDANEEKKEAEEQMIFKKQVYLGVLKHTAKGTASKTFKKIDEFLRVRDEKYLKWKEVNMIKFE